MNSSRKVPGSTEVKIGLFNAAVNGSWHLAPYSQCIAQIDMNQTENAIGEHVLFCQAQLANGIMLIISLILTFSAAVVMTFVLSNTLSLSKVILSKRICMAIYFLSGTYELSCHETNMNLASVNLIAFGLGLGVLYRLTARDFPGSYYGIGLIACIISWILSLLVLAGTFFLIDRNGSTRSFSILGEPAELKKQNELEEIRPAYY